MKLTLNNWLNWTARVESLLGHDLDGDQSLDGYSLDAAYELWTAGYSPAVAVELIGGVVFA